MVRSLSLTESDGFGWYLKEIETLPSVIHSLMPVKEGDRVVLIKDIDCSSHYKGCERFLKIGSTAIVNSFGIRDGEMYANLVFDNELCL